MTFARCCRWLWRRRTSSSTSPTPCPTPTSPSAWPHATTSPGQTTCLCASSTPSSRADSTTRRPRSPPAPPRFVQVIDPLCLYGPTGYIGHMVSSSQQHKSNSHYSFSMVLFIIPVFTFMQVSVIYCFSFYYFVCCRASCIYKLCCRHHAYINTQFIYTRCPTGHLACINCVCCRASCVYKLCVCVVGHPVYTNCMCVVGHPVYSNCVCVL